MLRGEFKAGVEAPEPGEERPRAISPCKEGGDGRSDAFEIRASMRRIFEKGSRLVCFVGGEKKDN
jgi:hypothetical protein